MCTHRQRTAPPCVRSVWLRVWGVQAWSGPVRPRAGHRKEGSVAGRRSLCVSRRLGGEGGRVLTERAGVSEREQRRELLRRGLRRVAPRGPLPWEPPYRVKAGGPGRASPAGEG